jgi:hypothetical protein
VAAQAWWVWTHQEFRRVSRSHERIAVIVDGSAVVGDDRSGFPEMELMICITSSGQAR